LNTSRFFDQSSIVFLGQGMGIGSATCGILSLFIVLQALTQAGTFRSTHPSQRLKSMSVDNCFSVSAKAFFGRPILETPPLPPLSSKRPAADLSVVLFAHNTSPFYF